MGSARRMITQYTDDELHGVISIGTAAASGVLRGPHYSIIPSV